MKRGTYVPITLAILAITPDALAAEPEAIRLAVDAPEGCVDEASLVRDVAALGGAFRRAEADARARSFAVEVRRDGSGHASGRLVVRDLVGEETTRTAEAPRCEEVARALAVFVALALDEAPAPPPPPPPTPPSPPAPAIETDAPPPLPRLGGGGIAVSGYYGGALYRGDVSPIAGVHAFAAWRVTRTTRLGIAGTFTQEDHNADKHAGTIVNARGFVGRAGALVGWGAPWTDRAAGFVGEVGLDAAVLHGDMSSSEVKGPTTWRVVSPYMSASFVLQIVTKLPVRPFWTVGLLFVPIEPSGRPDVAATTEMGLAWQAW